MYSNAFFRIVKKALLFYFFGEKFKEADTKSAPEKQWKQTNGAAVFANGMIAGRIVRYFAKTGEMGVLFC
jgi:hypothetical protein